MKVQTKYVGEVEVSESRVIQFEKGLPAFEEEKEFIVLPFSEDESAFFTLQSVNDVEVAFIIVNPFGFYSDYKVKLSDATIDQIQVEKEEDVAIFVMVTVKDPFAQSTANLQAPVVINLKTQKGKQQVMSDSGYQTKHILMPQEATKVGEGK
ncbi:flagellar assembly protein FliW [Bacillus sp. FJAT-45350]|uniref:flagellar assembly protein FliW n=1 Tax=Bacillus sp. FJAT-45350 TaxID=2011014 RepID=UPI000BB99291|nr:flagellar assembly protein FliW [Bacillus sp. FJAT-45350]